MATQNEMTTYLAVGLIVILVALGSYFYAGEKLKEYNSKTVSKLDHVTL